MSSTDYFQFKTKYRKSVVKLTPDFYILLFTEIKTLPEGLVQPAFQFCYLPKFVK